MYICKPPEIEKEHKNIFQRTIEAKAVNVKLEAYINFHVHCNTKS